MLVKVRASETHCGAVALSRNSPFVLCCILVLPSHGYPGSFRGSPPVQVLALLSRRNSGVYRNNFVSKGSNASKSPQLLTLQLRRGWGDKPVSFLEALQSLRGPTQNCHGFDTVTNAVCPASLSISVGLPPVLWPMTTWDLQGDGPAVGNVLPLAVDWKGWHIHLTEPRACC